MRETIPRLNFLGTTWLNVSLQRATYIDGSTAVRLFTEDGEMLTTASINLAPTIVTTDPNQFFIKDYSENDGLARALEDEKVIRVLGNTSIGPFDSPVYLVEFRGEWRS